LATPSDHTFREGIHLTLRNHARRTACLTVLAVVVPTVTLAPNAFAGSRSHGLSLYAVGTRVRYVKYTDGITRAKYQNPFNIDSKKFAPTTGKGVASPGNSVFFVFNLYSDAGLKHSLGTAIYTCRFGFNNNADCQAEYDLRNGALFASGPVDFKSTRTLLAITGGTGAYLGTAGQVVSLGATNAKSTSHLEFDLVK
jgi:hypothetical protein